jgi:hypothetical protein
LRNPSVVEEMKPRTFHITIHAERTTWGKLKKESLAAEIENAVAYLMLDVIDVEIKEKEGVN